MRPLTRDPSQKSAFLEAYERGIKGTEAQSPGLCPGCSQCADKLGYRDQEDEDGNVTKSALEQYDEDLEAGAICSEAHFSWSPCDICGSSLGGDREVWHFRMGVAPYDYIHHGEGICVDCVLFMVNGEEPEQWK